MKKHPKTMNKMLTAKEVMRAVAKGNISKETLIRCQNLAAYYTDKKTGKHFVGFVHPKDGPEQIEVTPDEYTILVSVGVVMSRFHTVYNTTNGMNGLLKIKAIIDRQI